MERQTDRRTQRPHFFELSVFRTRPTYRDLWRIRLKRRLLSFFVGATLCQRSTANGLRSLSWAGFRWWAGRPGTSHQALNCPSLDGRLLKIGDAFKNTHCHLSLCTTCSPHFVVLHNQTMNVKTIGQRMLTRGRIAGLFLQNSPAPVDGDTAVQSAASST